ncbi:MAG: SpoIIE family protein phosphatase [Bryobacteraceae bacterium]|nr:SpoIIE family protein phosphatase [Bryobacteraceae bacterium]
MAVRPLPVTRAASVVVNTPSGTRTRVPLHPTPFHIGRQSDNQLVLRDNRASRTHARIEVEAGEYYLQDLKSSHGTFVNNVRITRHKLQASDRIEFGFPDSYTLVFTYDDDELNRILDQFPGPHAGTNPGLSGNLQKLRALVEVARALQNSLAIEDVLAAVVEAALAITGCERGFLLLNHGGKLEVSVARDRYTGSLGKESLEVAPDALFDALLHRRELLSMTFNSQSAELSNQTLHGADLRSVVCIPLVRIRPGASDETCMITSRTDTVGVLYLDARQTSVDLSSGNRELLQTLALEASTVLENARLLEEERGRQRLDEELAIAREIQSSLLPRKLPSTGWFRAAGWSMPSHAVGGDCYDVRQLSPDSWSSVITDVSGKGVSSALLAALLQGSFLTGSGEIGAQMSRINSFLYERTEGEKYATVFYCILRHDGHMTWANAGHVKPYVIRANGELRTLQTTGMPLGMLDTAEFGVETLTLSPGDRILAYSDGLTEAQNEKGEFFNVANLRRVLLAHAGAPATKLLSELVNEVQQFTGGAVQSDDITALVLEYNPEP